MADRELNIRLNFVRDQAERAARQFHEGEQQRIRQDGEAAEAFLKRWSALWRKLQEARVKGVQDGYKAEEKAQEEAGKKLIQGAQNQQKAFLKLANELREARIKGIQDVAREEEKRLLAIAALRRRLGEARVKGEQAESASVLKVQEDTASAIIRDMLEKQKRLLEARRKLRQELATADQKGARDAIERIAAMEVESDRNAARRRVAQYRRLAEQQAKIATEASEEMKQIAARAAEYQEKGDQKAVAHARNVYAQRERVVKDAIDKANNYAKQAAIEVNATVEGLEGRHARVVKAQFGEMADGAKGYAKHATEAYRVAAKAGEQSFDTQKKATKGATEEVKTHGRQISAMAQQYILLRTAERTLRFIREGWEATVKSTADATRHIEQMVERTERLQESLTEVMRMANKAPSEAATAEEASRIAKFGVPLRSGVAAITEFEAHGGPFIGEGKEYRMTRQQANQFLEFAVPQAASIGLRDAEGQKAAQMIAATKMQTAPVDPRTGKVDLEKLKLEYAKSIRTVQKAVGRNSPAALQYAEAVRMHAFNAKDDREREDLDLIFAAMSEVTVDGERVAMDALFREIRQITEEDNFHGHNRYEELGFKPGMSDLERIKTAYAAIKKQAALDHVSVEELAPRYFDREHGYRAFVGYRKMIESGGDVRMRNERNQVTLDKAEEQNRQYLASDQAQLDSKRVQGEAIAAGRSASLGGKKFEIFRQQIKNDLVQSGGMEHGQDFWEAFASKKAESLGLGNREEYELHQLTGDKLIERLETLARQGNEGAAQFLKENRGNLKIGLGTQSLRANREAQMRAYQKVLEQEGEVGHPNAALQKDTGFAYATDLAVERAAKQRAITDLQRQGKLSPKENLDRIEARAKPPGLNVDLGAGMDGMPNATAPEDDEAAMVERHARQIVEQQRKLHGNNNEAILRGLAPPSNAAANDAELQRMHGGGVGLQSVPPTAAAAERLHPANAAIAAAPARGNLFGPGRHFAESYHGEMFRAFRERRGRLHLTAPGADGRLDRLPGADGRLSRGARAALRRGRHPAEMIAIHTDADKARMAEHAANTHALGAARRAAEAKKADDEKRRAFTRDMARQSDMARARMHIAKNHADLERHRAAARPKAPRAIPKPQFPDYGFGKGPIAIATDSGLYGAKLRSALDSNAADRDHEERMEAQKASRFRGAPVAPGVPLRPVAPWYRPDLVGAEVAGRAGGVFGSVMHNAPAAIGGASGVMPHVMGGAEKGVAAGLNAAARNLERATRQAVPAATPGRPFVMNN